MLAYCLGLHCYFILIEWEWICVTGLLKASAKTPIHEELS